MVFSQDIIDFPVVILVIMDIMYMYTCRLVQTHRVVILVIMDIMYMGRVDRKRG